MRSLMTVRGAFAAVHCGPPTESLLALAQEHGDRPLIDLDATGLAKLSDRVATDRCFFATAR